MFLFVPLLFLFTQKFCKYNNHIYDDDDADDGERMVQFVALHTNELEKKIRI